MSAPPPLAERMRPVTIGEFAGQHHLLGPNSLLKKILDSGRVPSLLLWGPPGCGKTTLATLLARSTGSPFYSISAVHSGVKDVRDLIEKSRSNTLFDTGTPILFIDEIHRFNKSQQDSLLEAVEKGWLVLIGATTENPSFEVIPALLSRCQVLVLEPLKDEDLEALIHKALRSDPYLKAVPIEIAESEALIGLASGDARKLFNLLELLCAPSHERTIRVTNAAVLELAQKNPAAYDRSGEAHYNTISAFIKSIRGSDLHASVFWLACLLAAGEDPLFIARRMIVLASEDIGLADPHALVMAVTCFQSLTILGMPEGRIVLSHAVIYLANAPKSNTAYRAIEQAMDYVNNSPPIQAPLHLRNPVTRLVSDLGYGRGYRSPHEFSENFIHQQYFPDLPVRLRFYIPGNNAEEDKIKARMKKNWGLDA